MLYGFAIMAECKIIGEAVENCQTSALSRFNPHFTPRFIFRFIPYFTRAFQPLFHLRVL